LYPCYLIENIHEINSHVLKEVEALAFEVIVEMVAVLLLLRIFEKATEHLQQSRD